MSLKKVRASWKRHRALVGRDIDIHAEWPTMFGLIRAGRPRWFVFLYLFFTVHSFPRWRCSAPSPSSSKPAVRRSRRLFPV
ncbi:hypothetical protein [Candidatus Amarobacter glycogenicus]|uniref:hypothetical protein n=1 Tax=Candidatus Amarobacter glycogenicus TaxID=3140699 RepID=UPI0031371CB1|nr:hypothetical protein [Dehalococcoidia bacterium]